MKAPPPYPDVARDAEAQADIPSNDGTPESMLVDKVVLQFGSRVLKGYTDRTAWRREWSKAKPLLSPPVLLLNAEAEQTLALDDVKAVFFVHSFTGEFREELRFHDQISAMESLWVRVTFDDDETIEGLLDNSADYLLERGFFLSPVDPEGNNWLVYVSKNQVKDFHVLGLRRNGEGNHAGEASLALQ